MVSGFGGRISPRARAVAAVFLALQPGVLLLPSQEPGRAPDALPGWGWPRSSEVWPAPEPFSLGSRDVRQALAVLRSAGLVVIVEGAERERRIEAVRTLEAVDAGTIDSYPPAHRGRWDILLNGTPLSWDTTYVSYGGELLNMRLLFTYRNQSPVPNIPYRLE